MELDRNRQTFQTLARIDIEPRVIGYEEKFLGLKKEPIYENKNGVEQRIYKEHFQPLADRNYQYKLENERLKAQNRRFESGLYLDTTGLNKTQREVLQSDISVYLKINEQEKAQKERLEREKKALQKAQKRSVGEMKI